ncbi:MAG: ferritin-like domain-containing protein [Gammaproteobacteria bacterium]|nr:ferritin-like domain-containing protein [Gammaproteobacteria bacterium]
MPGLASRGRPADVDEQPRSRGRGETRRSGRLRRDGQGARSWEALDVILSEEVRHVAIGSRWFRWCCEREGREPYPTFRELLASRYRGTVRGPFNLDARRAAREFDQRGVGHTECSSARLAGCV